MKNTKFRIVISLKANDNKNLLLSKRLLEKIEQSLGYRGSFFENSSSKYITVYKSPFVYKKAKSTYVYKNLSYLYVVTDLSQQKTAMVIKQLNSLKLVLDYSFSIHSC